MDKLKWYEKTADFIMEHLQEFYESFYDSKVESVGNSFRLNPCPMCGHNDCCTVGPAIHCFSCDWKGTHISAWYDYATNVKNITLSEAIKKLDDYTGLKFESLSEEDMAHYTKHQRQQRILREAEIFYSDQLIKSSKCFDYRGRPYTPLKYLLEVRKREMNTIKALNMGFSLDFLELRQKLLSTGFSKEEIKEAKIWAPEGLFVFFYHHPITKDIVRMNTKNPFEITFKIRDENGKEEEGDKVKGYSTGNKAMMYSPKFSFKKPFAIAEGEHDLASLIENGCSNACIIGGNASEEELKILEKAEDTIYACFDNDEVGEKYLETINSMYPEKIIKKVVFPKDFKDIDEYYVDCADSKQWDILKESAEDLQTEEYKITHEGNIWTIANRYKKIDYEIKGKNEKGGMIGTASLFMNNKLADREPDINLMKCKVKMKPMNFILAEAIEEYFNTDLDKKNLDELLDIYMYSAKKATIINLFAKIIYDSNNDEAIFQKLKLKIPSSDTIDEILKQVNNIQNSFIQQDVISYIPRMKVSQYFNTTNDDAYMYFTYIKKDGEHTRQLPYLLRNDGAMIRLDLLRRKDSQCLLLVDNKYELPLQVNEAIIEISGCSLTQDWATKFAEKQINPAEIEPGQIIREMETAIRRFYFHENPNVYKILALYAYTTYFCELYAEMPYLYLNGTKGSGKSVLDTVLLALCHNAKMAIDISEASLYRILNLEGGTLILDEMENLTDKNKTKDSTLAACLKGGYQRSGNIFRWNNEKNISDAFDPFGPKIISNINGTEDVIYDRCIQITSYSMHVTKRNRLESPKQWLAERRADIRSITSRCCISALVNFQEAYKIFNSSLFETSNARLTQIVTPLLATARLVDKKEREVLHQRNPEQDPDSIMGEYEKALGEYYETNIKNDKKDVDGRTPEGIIKKVVNTVARELYGLIPEKEIEYTKTSNHNKYSAPIAFNKEEGWFEIDVIHFKTFIEENSNGEIIPARMIPRWVKTVFSFGEKDLKRRLVPIEHEDLVKEFKGNAKPKVIIYRFKFSDFIKELGDDFINKDKTAPHISGSANGSLY